MAENRGRDLPASVKAQIGRLAAAGLPKQTVASAAGVSRQTVYRTLREQKAAPRRT